MDAAKQAVKNIIHKSGHHDTEVDERVNPSVTSETVKPHRHEETTQAVDREVHQHHYHTTVQPLEHQEVLPERHTHQQLPTQEKEFVHGDTGRVREGVEREAAKFGDTSTTHQTTHSTSQAAAATGEHVHHHVHETVQPVIHKETLQPEVVHTTVPIHETHHAQAEHHGISTLPTKTLNEFKELGGKITGGTQRHEEYEGHPRPYNPEMQQSRSVADTAPAAHDGLHGTHDTSGTVLGSGLTGTSGSNTGTGLTGSDHRTGTTGGLSGTGSNVSGYGTTGTGLTSSGPGSTGTALGGRTEGNTVGSAVDAARHGSSGATGSHGVGGIAGTSGIGSMEPAGRDLGHSSTDRTGGTSSHHGTGHTDTSSSTNTGRHGVSGDDVQTPSQGKDPSLVEETTSRSGGLKGEGVDGSHSAVFGLTPDGHRHDDTAHSTGSLRPAHTKPSVNNPATGDIGSRAPTGQSVAGQLHDPRVAEKGHGGPAVSDEGTAKPGAGAPGGEQGFGQVRPNEHGATSKVQNKLDPTTDADGDGKRGVLD